MVVSWIVRESVIIYASISFAGTVSWAIDSAISSANCFVQIFSLFRKVGIAICFHPFVIDAVGHDLMVELRSNIIFPIIAVVARHIAAPFFALLGFPFAFGITGLQVMAFAAPCAWGTLHRVGGADR